MMGATTPESGRRRAPTGHPLDILILGGTSFLGPHQIAYLQSRGHSVSIFTRGQTRPTIYKAAYREVEQLVGDRDGDLSALRGRRWDAVIDNSGQRVAWARDTARLLQDQVELYLYTSSTGVYYPYLGSDIDETTKVVLEAPVTADGDSAGEYSYGVMKANSEREVLAAFGADRAIIVRPTYIMGPADGTDRFTYWPVRLARGGEVMVPGQADDPVQYIDVRDLTGWMVRLIENHTAGTFNAVGPVSATGMHRFVFGAHAAFASAATFVPIEDYAFLREHRVGYSIPWIMPIGDNAGSARVSNHKAIEHGLTFTPLADSVRDIYDWWHSDAVTDERRTNLTSGPRSLMAREAEILSAWNARRSVERPLGP